MECMDDTVLVFASHWLCWLIESGYAIGSVNKKELRLRLRYMSVQSSSRWYHIS